MKKVFLAVLVTFAAQAGWTDTKMSAFPSTASLNASDLIPVVTTPGATPANKVITKSNLFSNMGAITVSTVAADTSLSAPRVIISSSFYMVDTAVTQSTFSFITLGSTVGARQVRFDAAEGVIFGKPCAVRADNSTECFAYSFNATPNGANAGPAAIYSYGGFTIQGSSANGNPTYSGFTSTNNVDQSTMWAIPRKDGTNGQAIITDGAKHLSFGSVASGGGSLPLPGGATNYIQNSSTLQTGTTAYPDFLQVGSSVTDYGAARIYGALDIGNNITGSSGLSRLSFDPSLSAPNLYIYANNNAASAGNINFVNSSGLTYAQISAATAVSAPLQLNDANGVSVQYRLLGATFTFTGPDVSTITYGVAVGSLTVNGAGDGTGVFTIAGSTYNVTSTSSTNTAFHMAGFSGTNGQQLIDIGLPIAPGGFGTINAGTAGLMSYYNIAGSTLSAIPGTLVTASSVTFPQTIVTSSFTVVVGGGSSGNTAAAMNLYVANDTIGQTRLFNFGSLQHVDQFYYIDKTYAYSEYGFKGSDLNYGTATGGGTTHISSIQSSNQYIDLYNSGEMDFQTSGFSTADMAFKPKTVEQFRVAFSTGVIAVGKAANKWTLATSTNTAASYTDADLQVTVSTNGALGYFGRSLAQMATIIPTKKGECFFPIDATVDSICCSTQTVTASWAKADARTTACQ